MEHFYELDDLLILRLLVLEVGIHIPGLAEARRVPDATARLDLLLAALLLFLELGVLLILFGFHCVSMLVHGCQDADLVVAGLRCVVIGAHLARLDPLASGVPRQLTQLLKDALEEVLLEASLRESQLTKPSIGRVHRFERSQLFFKD